MSTLLEQWAAEVNSRTGITLSTKQTYIRDARRILETDDCLPGSGYKTVLRGLYRLADARMARRKINCPG